jgi:malonyl CoA-acyl carrier protein transacylase
MEMMAAMDVDLFLEIGPGKVLAGLARQIAPAARVVNVDDRASLAESMEAIR